MSTTYLITGANRGLGKGLVAEYLSRPNNIVIAAVRDPDHPTSKELKTIPKAPSSELIIVKIESTSKKDAADALSVIEKLYEIVAVDVVIANAGISKGYPRVEEASEADLLEHFQVNTIGVVVLFQAVLPFLKRSKKSAKFVAVGTSVASIGAQEQNPYPNAVYAPSKAALNWLVKKIHLEHEDLIAFPIHPGWVQTDMGNNAAKLVGFEKADITIDQSVSGVVEIIETSTKESTSGKFMFYDGTCSVW